MQARSSPTRLLGGEGAQTLKVWSELAPWMSGPG